MYGLRGCAPCVSCMGLGLLKELKFLRVFQPKSTVVLKIMLMKNFLKNHITIITIKTTQVNFYH